MTATESKVFSDGIVDIVNLPAATAGLQIDLNVDVIDRHYLQAQTDNFRIAGILLVKVSQKFNVQFLFNWFWVELVQNLILD